MRIVKATVYIMGEKWPDWGHTAYIPEANMISGNSRIATSLAGIINVESKDYPDSDDHTCDDLERVVVAQHAADTLTNAKDKPGHGWLIAHTVERITQYIVTGDLDDDSNNFVRITRRATIEMPDDYTVLQRDLDGTTQYALVRCQLMPHMPNTPKRTRVL